MINVKIDKLFSVKSDGNLIPTQGIIEVANFLEQTNNHLYHILNETFRWDNNDTPWKQWKILPNDNTWGDSHPYTGTWVKRWGSHLYKRYNAVLPDDIAAIIGETLSRYISKKILHLEFTKYSDWKHTAFEPNDAGTCWWSEDKYADVRRGLVANPNGYSVLLYDSPEQWKKSSKVSGIGRCWMYVEDNRAYVFNAYGPHNLGQIANAIATLWKCQTDRIQLESALGFINMGEFNNDGRGGGRKGVGFCIHENDPVSKFILPDVRIKDGTCEMCSEPVVVKSCTRANRRVICDECTKHLKQCIRCGDWIMDDDAQKVYGRLYCPHCYERLSVCENHGRIDASMFRIWHTQRFVCRMCLHEHLAGTCDGCGHLLDYKVLRLVRLPKMNLNLCPVCTKKARERDD